MAPEPSTIVPQPKAHKEVVVATSSVPSQVYPVVVTVLPKQVRIPIVPSMTRYVWLPRTYQRNNRRWWYQQPAPISTPAVTVPRSQIQFRDTYILCDHVTISVPGHSPDHFPTNTFRATCDPYHGARCVTNRTATYSN